MGSSYNVITSLPSYLVLSSLPPSLPPPPPPSPLPHSTAQGDTITVTRKIDANWYEGYLGDKKGIFPITYVQLLEEGKR